jgi:hypothetical protein
VSCLKLAFSSLGTACQRERVSGGHLWKVVGRCRKRTIGRGRKVGELGLDFELLREGCLRDLDLRGHSLQSCHQTSYSNSELWSHHIYDLMNLLAHNFIAF